jgi:hypothetical protein
VATLNNLSGVNSGDQTTITGNAATATKLATAKTINGVAFDGSADITAPAAAETLTGTTLKSTVTGSSLKSVGTLANLTVTNPIAGSVTGNAATATNITGLTTSVATLNNLSGVNSGDQTTITGNAGTATKLATAKTINGVAFDGSADITAPAAAETLTGTTLKSTVTGSSLTSVGTLANLTVTAPITGSITGSSGSTTGNAGTATKLAASKTINGVAFDGSVDITVTANADTLTGTTLASNVVNSSLTSVGTLTSGTINLTTDIATTGNLKAGNNTYPNSNGNDGEFLKTNGSGTLSWASVPSPDLGNYVTTNTGQTIEETKTFSKDITVNGIRVGRGKNASDDTKNTAIGQDALSKNTGTQNTAIGFLSLVENIGGVGNTAIGSNSLFKNVSGANNTAIGFEALRSNVGSENTAVGRSALSGSISGSSKNTAIGYYALRSMANSTTGLLTGSGNTAVGSNSGEKITSGSNNVTIGGDDAVDTGSSNTLVGVSAKVSGTSTSNATAIGYTSKSAVEGTAIGNSAFALASKATALGNRAIVGLNASKATAIGNGAAVDASNATAIGNRAIAGLNASNSTAIGNGAFVEDPNTIQLGADGKTTDIDNVLIPAVTDVKTRGAITAAGYTAFALDQFGNVNPAITASFNVAGLTTPGKLTAGAVTYPNAHNSTSGQVLTIDSTGLATWAAAAGGVPYTGATQAVDLGAYELKTSGAITAGGKIIAGASSAASSSAVLEANSTTQGFLPPRMTLAQRNAITNPATGLMIWCSDNFGGEIEVFNGSIWVNMNGRISNSTLSVGDYHQGGKIAYIFVSGEPGWVANETHGLIAATSDQSTGVPWSGDYTLTGATGTAIGTGLSNTNTIITSPVGASISYAAGLARAHNGGGYTDWYLPSIDELKKLQSKKNIIGGFANEFYWSSTEFNKYSPGWDALVLNFQNASETDQNRTLNSFKVRAVRTF